MCTYSFSFTPTSQLVMAGNIFAKGIKLLLAVSITFYFITLQCLKANGESYLERTFMDLIERGSDRNEKDSFNFYIDEMIDLESSQLSMLERVNKKILNEWLDELKGIQKIRQKAVKLKNKFWIQYSDEASCVIRSYLATKFDYEPKEALSVCQYYFNEYINNLGLDSVASITTVKYMLDIFELYHRYDMVLKIAELLKNVKNNRRFEDLHNDRLLKSYIERAYSILKQYSKVLEENKNEYETTFRMIHNDKNIDYRELFDRICHHNHSYVMDALIATKAYDRANMILEDCIKQAESYLERHYITNYEHPRFVLKLGDNAFDPYKDDLLSLVYYPTLFKPYALIPLLQNQIQESLEKTDRIRAIGLSMVLHKKLEPIKFLEMQQLAKENNSTLVIYSIFPNFGSADPSHKEDLGIFVVQPSGQLYFKLVPLNNIPSIVSSTSETLQQRSEQKIQSKQAFSSVVIFIGVGGLIALVTCLVLCINHKKIWYANGIAVVLVIGGVSLFLYVQNQVLILNKPDPEETPSPTVVSSGSLMDITRLIKSSFSQNRSIGVDNSQTTPKDDQDCPNQEACLASLYQILIKPIEEYLPKEENSSIIFVPEGELYKVSFASLKDTNGSYLIDKYAIAVTPSLRVLKALKKKDKNTASYTDVLIVGNPIMPPDPQTDDAGLYWMETHSDQIESELQNYRNSPPLSYLPNAEMEAREIAKLFGTTPLIGSEATKEAVLSKMGSVRIIHLATHGLPYGFGILTLTPTQFDSGYLTGYHFVNENLNAELVVLSACETGVGKVSTEGGIGLARPFFMAGVPTVVASLWQVPDASTAELMVDFYKNMQTTNNKAQALRQAMLKTKEKYPDPYHWAGFVLFGRP